MDIISEYTSKWKLKVDEVSKKAEETAGNVWQHRKRVFPYLSIVDILIFFFKTKMGLYAYLHLCIWLIYLCIFSERNILLQGR